MTEKPWLYAALKPLPHRDLPERESAKIADSPAGIALIVSDLAAAPSTQNSAEQHAEQHQNSTRNSAEQRRTAQNSKKPPAKTNLK